MNGLTLLLALALAAGIVVAWRAGVAQGRRQTPRNELDVLRPAPMPAPVPVPPPPVPVAAVPANAVPAVPPASDAVAGEQARLVRSLAMENAALRARAVTREAEAGQLAAFAEERRRLYADLAAARTETARYRALVVDIENNALPPLLDGPHAPDDLKLIVGVGPMLERMLHQLGVTTYRQVARWSERDIDEFDAKLAEFPGRIRRDGWVAQARALHQSKFGETLPATSARGVRGVGG